MEKFRFRTEFVIYSGGAVWNELRSRVTSRRSGQTEEKYAIAPSIDCISKDLKTNSSAYGLEREWSMEIEIMRAGSIKTPLRRLWSHPNKQLNLPRHERRYRNLLLAGTQSLSAQIPQQIPRVRPLCTARAIPPTLRRRRWHKEMAAHSSCAPGSVGAKYLDESETQQQEMANIRSERVGMVMILGEGKNDFPIYDTDVPHRVPTSIPGSLEQSLGHFARI